MQDFDTGTRVLYVEKNGRTRQGTVRSVANKFVDVELDDMHKRTFYVPIDTLMLLPPDLDTRNTE